MYRLFTGFLGIAAFMLQCGCGTGKYADIKIVIREMIEARETFVADAERADCPRTAALSITSLESRMKKLGPRYEELEKKYPELLRPEDLPLELKELVATLNRTAALRDDALTNILMRYPDDAAVQKAVSSMGSVYK